jgi:hypothetical protein
LSKLEFSILSEGHVLHASVEPLKIPTQHDLKSCLIFLFYPHQLAPHRPSTTVYFPGSPTTFVTLLPPTSVLTKTVYGQVSRPSFLLPPFFRDGVLVPFINQCFTSETLSAKFLSSLLHPTSWVSDRLSRPSLTPPRLPTYRGRLPPDRLFGSSSLVLIPECDGETTHLPYIHTWGCHQMS